MHRSSAFKIVGSAAIFSFLGLFAITGSASAATLSVPGGFATVQAALDAAGPGDTIELATGTYSEKVEFKASGTMGSPIILTEASGASAVLDGTGVGGDNLILIDNRSYVQVVGLELRNNLGVTDGSGIRVLRGGAGIELRDNEIHNILGKNAMGITVYATIATAISDILIDGNYIHDCEPSPSEALVVNGNVDGFVVTNNVVEDVNNIAIDAIGGETDIQPNSSLVARNGRIAGNAIARCGSGFSGGIYVDGGKDIIIENNTVTECDLGIEVAAENNGILTTNVVVRSNILYFNRVVGIVFGGFKASVGRANLNVFRNNTLYKNATDASDGIGEIWAQYGDNNIISHNIVVTRTVADGGVPNVPVASFNNTNGNVFDYNLYWSEDGAPGTSFSMENQEFSGFAAWQGAGFDANGQFADPELFDADAADFHISAVSPAANAGDPALVTDVGEVDLDGSDRVSGITVDIGADEITCGDNVVGAGEECDDGGLVDGDGCDSNCTFTACGNAILTAGETCDDGNTDVGDCCDATCSLEVAGSSCDDGTVCTLVDECDGLGACIGDATPDAACLIPLAAKGSSVKIKEKGDRDLIVWKWKKGPTVLLADFGTPNVADDYTLCVYETDGATEIFIESDIPAGSAWADKGAKGFKYKDHDRAVLKVQLKPGEDGRAKITLKGKGPALAFGPLAFGPAATVAVQLRSDSAGSCFGASFDAPFQVNDASQFKDSTD
ncbi:MAG: cysteine-rich repeat protein/parallel beta-helix repeat protein [Candidatus Binatia bacterium]|jgi:cysteine-rich repeat protein/parallel beta-helix repeat protein